MHQQQTVSVVTELQLCLFCVSRCLLTCRLSASYRAVTEDLKHEAAL